MRTSTPTGRVRRPVTFAIGATLVLASVGCGALSRPDLGGPGFGPTVVDDERGSFGSFLWAVEPGPERTLPPLDPATLKSTTDRAIQAITTARDVDFGIALIATFATPADADRQAVAVREILAASARWYADPANVAARARRDDPNVEAPLAPPELAVMDRALLSTATRGMGWGGEESAVADAVRTVGPILIVTGLKSEAPTTEKPPLHPLAHFLAAAGGDVLLEGDRFGEGAIVVDLSCRLPDAEGALTARDELGDAVTSSRFVATPPWVARPTPSQAEARQTVRRFQAMSMAAMTDPTGLALMRRLENASSAERQRLTDELAAHIRERLTKAEPGDIRPDVLALLGSEPTTGGDLPARVAWLRELGGLIGQLPLAERATWPDADVAGPLPLTASVRVAEGTRLDVGWLSLGRTSTGLTLALAWLTEEGCTDIHFRLVDMDSI